MTRKLLLAILAVVPALFMPLAATSQIAPDRPPRIRKQLADQLKGANDEL